MLAPGHHIVLIVEPCILVPLWLEFYWLFFLMDTKLKIFLEISKFGSSLGIATLHYTILYKAFVLAYSLCRFFHAF